MKKLPLLRYTDIVITLRYWGFEQRRHIKKREDKETVVKLHPQWIAKKPFRKVTVCEYGSEFHQEVIDVLIKQAGLSKKDFYFGCGYRI